MSTHNAHKSHLPKIIQTESGPAPEAPATVAGTGIARTVLVNLVLRYAHVSSQISTDGVAKQLMLSRVVAGDLLDQLRKDALLEVLGQDETFGYRYTISGRGREMAARLMENNGYIGPAPVTLEAYMALLEWQVNESAHVSPAQIREALADLVLPEDVMQVAGVAMSSGRSLFISGPPGNGKTSMGRKLHNALTGGIWIPHCISVGDAIIRIYDSHCHEIIDESPEKLKNVDRRWLKIHRPFIVAGGEMTLESMDLSYIPTLKYYEAPLHMKANGGTFLIDDFGRQRVEPHALLNRWIIPLENQIDFLTLNSGQKIQVPFLLMLIIATNLEPKDVTDPAFLRRLGYRTRLGAPSEERYAKIFEEYLVRSGVAADAELIKYVLGRYKETQKELRSCEPRDLIERVRDICEHNGEELRIDKQLLDLAWGGYFGNEAA